ncbi:Ig-like domain-containing protein [Streptomyces sp. NPDC057757]|uniref:Ig-like domain-containing protein n=1 Tax=Streptomyces sp. NPDC057757 TaxID=3346241 RepID=UPI0036C6FB09
MAACAVLALGVVALVAAQSQPARAASVGEFTMTPGSGTLSDTQPIAGSVGLPGACPDVTIEDLNWNNFLNLYVVKADGTEAPALRGVGNGAPYDQATETVSLAAADNPGLAVSDLATVITGDGTYELRLYCVDNQSLDKPTEDWVPGNPYWSQKITVTGDDWVVGEGATATGVSLTTTATTPEPGQEITLTATVAPAQAAGKVTFKDGATTLGEATAADGKAEFRTSTLSEGAHQITARFAATNPAEWGASESTPVTVTVQLPRTELLDATGERLADNPELDRGQTVKVVVRGCEPGAKFTMAMDRNDTAFPDATADTNGVVTWPTLTVPADAVEGQSAWDFSPNCAPVTAVAFTVAAPASESPSGDPSASEDPSDDPTDEPTDDPTGDTSGGDTSGTTSGTTGGDTSGGATTGGGDSGTGGTSPQGGLASTGSQIALFSGIGAVVLAAAGFVLVRFGRRNGLLSFGEPRP